MEDQTTFSSADGHDITVDGFSPAQSNTDYPGDAFVAKYDKNGIAKWVNHAGGYKAISTAIAVLANGEVSIGGFIGNINYGSASDAETIVTSQPPEQASTSAAAISPIRITMMFSSPHSPLRRLGASLALRHRPAES